MSNFEADPICVGMQRFGEQACQDPDLARNRDPDSARDLGACATCAVRLEGMAFNDQLTELPNRAAAELHFNALVADMLRTLAIHGDVMSFGYVNKRLGHEAGDHMLRLIASRFSDVCSKDGEQTLVARYGGDEFAFITPLEPGEAASPHSRRFEDKLPLVVSPHIRVAEGIIRRLTEAVTADTAIIRYNMLFNWKHPLGMRFNYAVHDPCTEPPTTLNALMKQADSKGIATGEELAPELAGYADWLATRVEGLPPVVNLPAQQ